MTHLPNNIKVTSLNGASLFELHTSFHEDNCWKEGKEPYAANVYVLKQRGSDFAKERHKSLIIEVSDNGEEVRMRSGIKKDQAMQAKVHVLHHGKEFVATLNRDEHGKATQSWQISEDSPFKASGKATYSCVKNCCKHYSEENKQQMEQPQQQMVRG